MVHPLGWVHPYRCHGLEWCIRWVGCTHYGVVHPLGGASRPLSGGASVATLYARLSHAFALGWHNRGAALEQGTTRTTRRAADRGHRTLDKPQEPRDRLESYVRAKRTHDTVDLRDWQAERAAHKRMHSTGHRMASRTRSRTPARPVLQTLAYPAAAAPRLGTRSRRRPNRELGSRARAASPARSSSSARAFAL